MRRKATALDVFGVPSEDDEQIMVIRWAELSMGKWPELKWLYHIPNGGKRRKVEAARFKAMGVKRGVPDLHLPVARGGYHGLWIEMKRREDGRMSKDQVEWIGGLEENGHCVCRCDGWEQAVAVLEGYLRGKVWKEEDV